MILDFRKESFESGLSRAITRFEGHQNSASLCPKKMSQKEDVDVKNNRKNLKYTFIKIVVRIAEQSNQATREMRSPKEVGKELANARKKRGKN